MKKMLILSCIFSLLGAAELMSAQTMTPESWNSSAVKIKDSCFSIKTGKVETVKSKPIPVNPAKKYRLSGEFRSAEGNNVGCFGLIYVDRNGREIIAGNVWAVPGTDTVILHDAKKGDQEIKLKDCSAWNKKRSRRTWAVFLTKEDQSDLPNYNVSPRITRVKRAPGDQEWTVRFQTPLHRAFPAGSRIRQHYLEYSNNCGFGYASIKGEWKKYESAVITGTAPDTAPKTQFWAGTVAVKIYILANAGRNQSELLFRQIKLEELD